MVEPTHLKNMSQIGNLPQIGVKIKNIGNHHVVLYVFLIYSSYGMTHKRVKTAMLYQCFHGMSMWEHFHKYILSCCDSVIQHVILMMNINPWIYTNWCSSWLPTSSFTRLPSITSLPHLPTPGATTTLHSLFHRWWPYYPADRGIHRKKSHPWNWKRGNN